MSHALAMPPEIPPSSLARRITIHSALLIAVCSVVLSTVSYLHHRRRLFEHAREIGWHMHADLTAIAESGLRDELTPNVLRERLQADAKWTKSIAGPGHRAVHLTLLKPDGSPLVSVDTPAASIEKQGPGDGVFSPDFKYLTLTRSFDHGGESFTLILQIETAIPWSVRKLLVRTFAWTTAILAAGLALSWVFARRNLEPVRALTDVAARIRSGDLHVRAHTDSGDELALLAGTFNEMVTSLERRMALLHRMQEWTIRVARELDPARLNDVLTEMFERMAQCVSVRLYRVDPASCRLDLVAYRGGDTTISLRGDPLCRTACERMAPRFLKEDGREDAQPHGAWEWALPLHSGGNRIGVVRLGRREDGQPYAEEHVTTLLTIAQIASVALENARLHRELSERARVEQEMQLARQIQQDMLPRRMPDVPGYALQGISVAALEVGGDYFDVVPAGDGTVHLLVGDVSGKGVPAALVMSIVRSLIHTYAEFTSDPVQILERVNRSLARDIESEMFVTLASLRLDPVRHRGVLARAGHEPVLLIRATGAVERLEPAGAGVGLLDPDLFPKTLATVELALEPGDTVLLYTDGLTETRSPEGQELGYEGLEALALRYRAHPLDEMVQALTGEIRSFAGTADPHDDYTLLAVRRTG